MARFHIFLALFSIILIHASSSSIPSTDTESELPLLSLRIKPNLTSASSCTFRVEIKTSCNSVSYTRDQISLSFGDAYGNQVYVPRIDNPSARAFEACSTDTYDVTGPCTYDVCYVYLYRRGYDGWKVQSVRISSPYIRTVTFKYNSWIQSDVWFGYNYCNGSSSQGYKPPLSTLIMTLVALLFLTFEWCLF
ncbi:embryo-specific protein ATS3A isoform X2 [Spinacia oleracea]|uniref:Embryo-specific protein ATS3A isoform X2 n=1 Tax=Spinacia oleracea TaxID=3562 RepID=A0A9R0JJ97_SPIOL|nr:embryo-specific protein ATS3A isoform X2 [Spinacia oleracea]